MIQNRNLIKARCGQLRLKFNRKAGRWLMTGGKYGEHCIYEPCYNTRTNAHWFGYCQNNGHKPNAADNCPAELS